MSSHHARDFAIAVVAVASLVCTRRSIAEVATIDQISAAWTAREARIKTADVQCVMKMHIVRGTQMGDKRRAAEDAGRQFPPQDTDETVMLRLIFDGDRFRHERSGRQWYALAGSVVDFRRAVIFDGADIHEYWDIPFASDANHKTGTRTIGERTQFMKDILREQHNVPLVQTLRPMNPRFGDIFTMKAAPWRIRDELVPLGTVACVLIENDFVNGFAGVQWWLDPQHQFALQRILLNREDKPIMQVDIDYRDDTQFGWAPRHWAASWYIPETGQLRESFDVSVNRFVLNEPVDPDVFRADYPAGTLVRENALNEESHTYIALPSGGRRDITKDEEAGAVRYTELLQTSSGQTGLPKDGSGAGWIIALIGAAGVILVAYLALRRR